MQNTHLVQTLSRDKNAQCISHRKGHTYLINGIYKKPSANVIITVEKVFPNGNEIRMSAITTSIQLCTGVSRQTIRGGNELKGIQNGNRK